MSSSSLTPTTGSSCFALFPKACWDRPQTPPRALERGAENEQKHRRVFVLHLVCSLLCCYTFLSHQEMIFNLEISITIPPTRSCLWRFRRSKRRIHNGLCLSHLYALSSHSVSAVSREHVGPGEPTGGDVCPPGPRRRCRRGLQRPSHVRLHAQRLHGACVQHTPRHRY